MPSATVQRENPLEPPPAHPAQLCSDIPEIRGHGVHVKALRIITFWSESGRTPGCPACETPGPGKSHTRECKAHQDAWEESRQTARAEEAKRKVDEDPDAEENGNGHWCRRRERARSNGRGKLSKDTCNCTSAGICL